MTEESLGIGAELWCSDARGIFGLFVGVADRARLAAIVADRNSAQKHVWPSTPTSCSWPNAIEGFFAKLTRRRLKRGNFPSLVALQEAINRFIEHHNQAPKPFTWKADPKAIIAAAKRGHQNVGDRIH